MSGSDPLTGGGAYKPDYSGSKKSKGKRGGAADPFTGGSGYKPEDNQDRGGTGANMARYIPGESVAPSKIEKHEGAIDTNPDRYLNKNMS